MVGTRKGMPTARETAFSGTGVRTGTASSGNSFFTIISFSSIIGSYCCDACTSAQDSDFAATLLCTNLVDNAPDAALNSCKAGL